MAQVLVRNLPDEVHRALRVRAVSHGRSAASELRHIIMETVLPCEADAIPPRVLPDRRGGAAQNKKTSKDQFLSFIGGHFKTDKKLTIEEMNDEIARCYAEAGMKGLK